MHNRFLLSERKIVMYIKNNEILKKGYSIVYKASMTDERLSLTAKAIYAYLCSYAGSKAIEY